MRAEGLPGRVAVADAGYGASGPFRDGLARRCLHSIVGVTDELPRSRRGRPRGRRPGDRSPAAAPASDPD